VYGCICVVVVDHVMDNIWHIKELLVSLVVEQQRKINVSWQDTIFYS
jgi:hypothetical protein